MLCPSCDEIIEDWDIEQTKEYAALMTENCQLKEYIVWFADVGLSEMRANEEKINKMLANCGYKETD